jgi:hypothetical protein
MAYIFRAAAESGIALEHRVRTPEDISVSGREPVDEAAVNWHMRASKHSVEPSTQ